MIKKISNWLFGGFFRTIGRSLAVILLGALFAYFAFKSGFKITDLFGIDYVKAATTYSWTTKQSRLYLDQQGTETTTSWETIPHTFSPSYPVSQMQYRLQYSGGLKSGNTYKFKISFLPNPDAINSSGIWFSDGTTTLTDVNCSGWARESNNYYANVCTISPESDISSNGYLYVRIVFNSAYVSTIRSYLGDFEETKGTGAIIQDSAIDIMNNQNENTQAIIDSNKVCQEYNKTYNLSDTNGLVDSKYLDVNGNVTTSSNVWYYTQDYIKVSKNETYILSGNAILVSNASYCLYDKTKTLIQCYKYTSNNINITPTQDGFIRYSLYLQNTYYNSNFKGKYCQNGSQALQDSIDDDNVSGANDKALDFFNNFNDNSHGLSSIITTPLNTIRLMLSDTCVAPHTVYKGKTISLPCGSILWSRPGADSLKDFLNLVYGGLLSYYLVANLLSLVNDFKNPDNDKIEVTDL